MTITNSLKDDQFHLLYGIRPCIGEVLSGDEIILHRHEYGIFFGIIDGLGHGKKAAAVAQDIRDYCLQFYHLPLAVLLTQAHEHFKGSQGAAIALCHVQNDGQAEYIGLGNVETRLLHNNNTPRPIVLLPRDGALGIRLRTIQSTIWQMLDGESIVMYSDGMSSQLLKNSPPSLHIHHPSDIRSTIDQYGKSHDDAALLFLHKPMPTPPQHA